VAAVLAGVAGCATTRQNPLRVGITPDYPPLVFEQGDGVAGAEMISPALWAHNSAGPCSAIPCAGGTDTGPAGAAH